MMNNIFRVSFIDAEVAAIVRMAESQPIWIEIK